ncbi:20S proteasome subunit alpha 2 [Nematocida minor]|uniref:20S proteasome subunit alpha 2 n=1 Tax=Nematocida minor TaxID=1912983 RepID=UPI00221F549E|nr:20S proteasome subunit alpha 2 [Nematocida minor]KAI5192643.1 20S proteasome subunit alpha 2 [Nematocida minor]
MSQNIDVSGRYTDTGNILQIEYARKAAAKGHTTIGIAFKDGVILAVDKKAPSKLVDINRLMYIESISDAYAMAYTGLGHDAFVVKHELKNFCAQILEAREREPLEEEFFDQARAYLSHFTSYMSWRPVGCEFLVSSQTHKGVSLFHIDPSGSVNRCKAYAVGLNAQAAKTELEKIHTDIITREDAVEAAVRVLHLSKDELTEGSFVIEMVEILKEEGIKRVSEEEIGKLSEGFQEDAGH